jgi:hypothetical protein
MVPQPPRRHQVMAETRMTLMALPTPTRPTLRTPGLVKLAMEVATPTRTVHQTPGLINPAMEVETLTHMALPTRTAHPTPSLANPAMEAATLTLMDLPIPIHMTHQTPGLVHMIHPIRATPQLGNSWKR